jgi:hypothetical protein
LRTVQRCKVNEGKYVLIEREKRPYCYVAKETGEGKTFEELWPAGLTIQDRKAVSA